MGPERDVFNFERVELADELFRADAPTADFVINCDFGSLFVRGLVNSIPGSFAHSCFVHVNGYESASGINWTIFRASKGNCEGQITERPCVLGLRMSLRRII